jgi:hypothetical protein
MTIYPPFLALDNLVLTPHNAVANTDVPEEERWLEAERIFDALV